MTYMGYPFGDGKVGDQTGKEIKEGLRGRDGLIEFLSAEVRRSRVLSRRRSVMLMTIRTG